MRHVAFLAIALAAAPVHALDKGVITLVVGFAPGGTSSIVAQYLAEGLQGKLNTSVIVDNRPGAGGLVAAEYVKKQPPDGRTLLVLSSTTLMKIPPSMEITPISQVATFDYVFAVGSNVQADTLGKFLDAARKDESLRTYAVPGAGTLPHLIAEAMGQKSNVPLIPVQFRGSAPAALNVLGGHVPAAMLPMPDFMPHQGSIRAIAVTSERRSHLLPNVPTLAEEKFNIETAGWIGLFAPLRMPPKEIQRLNQAVKEVIASNPGFLAERGFQPTGTTPQEFARIHRRDFERWHPVLQRLAIAP